MQGLGRNGKNYAALILASAAVGLVYLAARQKQQQQPSIRQSFIKAQTNVNEKTDDNNIIDGCYHVYLDVGSNVGIQVRKLYEPHFYPSSGSFKIFDEQFGEPSTRNLSRICAVGFEPNPSHEARLKEIESAYNRCGWRVTFLTGTAAGERDEEDVTFYTNENYEKREAGASVVKDNVNLKSSKGKVRMLRLSSFINDVVATRKLTLDDSDDYKASVPPAVVMKLDVEGSEIEILPDLLLSGSFQHVHKSMVEFHHRLASTKKRAKISKDLQEAFKILETILGVVQMDDEKHNDSEFPLPSCGDKR